MVNCAAVKGLPPSSARVPRAAYLFMRAGERVYRFTFSKEVTTIGCAKGNDIVIFDSSVADTHCCIRIRGGAWSVSPLRGAVHVDDQLVRQFAPLSSGSRLRIGGEEILFVLEQDTTDVVHLLIHAPGKAPLGMWTRRSTIVIGGERGDVVLDDPLVSPVHAVIENHCAHGRFLVDAKSERGTALNGRAVVARRYLKDGDRITVGNTSIEVRFDIPAELQRPEPEVSAPAEIPPPLAEPRIRRHTGRGPAVPESWGNRARNAPRKRLSEGAFDSIRTRSRLGRAQGPMSLIVRRARTPAAGHLPADLLLRGPRRIPAGTRALLQVIVDPVPVGPDAETPDQGPRALPLDLRSDDRLTITLEMPGVAVEEEVVSLRFRGRTSTATFSVDVPASAAEGTRHGTLMVRRGSTPLGCLTFRFTVVPAGSALLPAEQLGHDAKVYP